MASFWLKTFHRFGFKIYVSLAERFILGIINRMSEPVPRLALGSRLERVHHDSLFYLRAHRSGFSDLKQVIKL